MAVHMSVKWYQSKINLVTKTLPVQAHQTAAAGAAAAAAGAIHSTYTNTLARLVSKPETVTPLASLIGTDKVPYAAIEHFGGRITPRSGKRMLIYGRAIGSRGIPLRSTARGRTGFAEVGKPAGTPAPGTLVISSSGVVASAASVPHVGKKYLERARDIYPDLFAAVLRKLMAGAGTGA